jgi:hypothetical protein
MKMLPDELIAEDRRFATAASTTAFALPQRR